MRARWMVILPIALAAAGPRARAQSTSAQAQSLFDEGRKLLQAGKLTEACAAFDASQKLDPAVTTLLNLADCREQNRQLATAWGTFVDANRLARSSGNDKLAKVATNHARKLEPRLSKLTIAVAADRQVPGLEVLRGTEPVNPASWNHALPIDGGTYTLTARAPGRSPWTITRTIKPESDNQTIEVPRLDEAKPAPPPAVSRTSPPVAPPQDAAKVAATAPPARTAERPAEPPAPVSDAPPATTDAPPSLAVPIAVGAGALVLGGVAFGAKLSGDKQYDNALAANRQGDAARAQSLYDTANTRRYVAIGLGVAAAGTAGLAIYLYVHGRGERRSDPTALVPLASPQLAGLAVLGHW